jgi:hypothetical protein
VTAGRGASIVHVLHALRFSPTQDPEAWRIDFDDAFWVWWRGEHPDPSSGSAAQWGRQDQPTREAAVRLSLLSSDRLWPDYIALHHNGALELELGEHGAQKARIERAVGGEIRAFRLITIIGRAWSAFALYDTARKRFGIIGPSELSLALRDTACAFLENLARGWPEPWDYNHVTPAQPDKNLLLRRELFECPTEEGQRHLAMQIGAWLEESWGSSHKRYLARDGPSAGQFDVTKHQWPW